MAREKHNQKRTEDEEDVHFIFNEILRFATMSFDDYKTHIENHPEDRLHSINLPEPEGEFRLMSRAASERFCALTYRLLKSKKLEANRGDFDESTLNQSIRDAFAHYFLLEKKQIERKFVDRMLNKAQRAALANHTAVTHYLPCVLVTKREPREFHLGVVRFIQADKFFAEYGAQIKHDLESQSKESRKKAKEMTDRGKLAGPLTTEAQWSRIDQMTLTWIHKYYEQYDWIAEVAVPPCDPKVSRQRAELVVQASLDLLKVVFGWCRAKGVRLGPDRNSQDKTAHLIRTTEERFEWSIALGSIAAVLVEDGWFEQIKQHYGRYLDAAGQAIETYLSPHQPTELCERWLDALNWCGQAVSEPLPSAQIVKYTAALERLTITKKTTPDADKGVTESVARRVAILAVSDQQESFEAVCKNARTIYAWRSKLMHGRSSPASKDESVENDMRTVRNQADELTRNVLFGAIDLYADLLMSGKSRSENLEEWFHRWEVPIDAETEHQSCQSSQERLPDS